MTGNALGRALGYQGKWPSHWLEQIEHERNGRHLSYAHANLLIAMSEGYTPVGVYEG